MSSIIDDIKNFKNKHIAVVGDVMLDHYIKGKVERISPEAPVPVVSVTDFSDRAGGAANVALNIKAMGANCSLFSIIGNDANGKKMVNICKSNKINVDGLIASTDRITTLKARVIGNNHQLLRYDFETTQDISNAEEEKLVNAFKKFATKNKTNAVVLEDYNKGVLTKNVITEIIDWCNVKGIATLVDPKKNNFFAYQNCTLFKPNLKEIKESLHNISIQPELNNLLLASKILQKKLHNKISIITLAEKGVFYHSKNKSEIIPAHIRNIADVSGAGDTVVALLALGLASEMNLHDVVELSNLAGGLVCEQPGVVTINPQQLINELKFKN